METPGTVLPKREHAQPAATGEEVKDPKPTHIIGVVRIDTTLTELEKELVNCSHERGGCDGCKVRARCRKWWDVTVDTLFVEGMVSRRTVGDLAWSYYCAWGKISGKNGHVSEAALNTFRSIAGRILR